MGFDHRPRHVRCRCSGHAGRWRSVTGSRRVTVAARERAYPDLRDQLHAEVDYMASARKADPDRIWTIWPIWLVRTPPASCSKGWFRPIDPGAWGAASGGGTGPDHQRVAPCRGKRDAVAACSTGCRAERHAVLRRCDEGRSELLQLWHARPCSCDYCGLDRSGAGAIYASVRSSACTTRQPDRPAFAARLKAILDGQAALLRGFLGVTRRGLGFTRSPSSGFQTNVEHGRLQARSRRPMCWSPFYFRHSGRV